MNFPTIRRRYGPFIVVEHDPQYERVSSFIRESEQLRMSPWVLRHECETLWETMMFDHKSPWINDWRLGMPVD